MTSRVCATIAAVPALLVLALAAAVAAPAAHAPATASAGSSLQRLAAVPDGAHAALRPEAARRLAASELWGGPYRTSTGETVRVLLSESYPEDLATGQRWAEFLASLVHGPEITDVTAYVLPPREIRGFCGQAALACYSGGLSTIVAPGQDTSGGIPAEAIMAHEYGHHVANNRDNPPWSAVEWGTKRWSSRLGICTGARSGQVFPGDEGGDYRLNPGEGFAEAYRVLNERHLGRVETAWNVVSEVFYPTDEALELLREDVLTPWTANTTSALAGRGPRGFSLQTPLDGVLRIAVRGSRTARLGATLLDAGGRPVAAAKGTRGRAATLTTTVCGSRSYRLRVTGSGTYRITISRP